MHPSAGPIPRRDAEIIAQSNRVTFWNLREASNGTVTRQPPSQPVASAGGGGSPQDPVGVEKPNDQTGLSFLKASWLGANLQFVAPKVVEGEPVAQLQAASIEKGNEKWSSALVFYVVGFKPTLAAVYRFISQQLRF